MVVCASRLRLCHRRCNYGHRWAISAADSRNADTRGALFPLARKAGRACIGLQSSTRAPEGARAERISAARGGDQKMSPPHATHWVGEAEILFSPQRSLKVAKRQNSKFCSRQARPCLLHGRVFSVASGIIEYICHQPMKATCRQKLDFCSLSSP